MISGRTVPPSTRQPPSDSPSRKTSGTRAPSTPSAAYSTQDRILGWRSPTTVDTGSHIVSGQVSHLCLFGLFAGPAAGPAATAHGPSGPLSGNSQAQPQPLPRTPMGTFTGMAEWITGLLPQTPLYPSPSSSRVLPACSHSPGGRGSPATGPGSPCYLVSATGFLWALFLFTHGGPPWESLFLFTTITGVNLIVHILRFDRIDLLPRAWRGYVKATRRW